MNRQRQTEIDRDPQKLPSTTSYYKARTQYVPVLLRTTKLAHSTSQYYFVLQSSHTVLPSTTSYYKACTQYFPVYYFVLQSSRKVRPSTKLAQNTCQYYFVLQSSHKVFPSTTSYRKACTKYFKIAMFHQFLTIEPHFVRKVCNRTLKIAILHQFLTIEPHFVRKGCISRPLVGTAPRLKREIEKKEREEGKRARERRCEKMRR